VAQQPIQAERTGADKVWRIFDGRWRYTVHSVYSSASGACWDTSSDVEAGAEFHVAILRRTCRRPREPEAVSEVGPRGSRKTVASIPQTTLA
jgi:hypothetical protein